MDLSTKLKITAVMAAVLMAVIWPCRSLSEGKRIPVREFFYGADQNRLSFPYTTLHWS